MSTFTVGRGFEDMAARWLEARGWRVLARNVRFRRKEVDLIARRGRLVAFVEVKGRSGGGYGTPAEAVTWRKRREIESVARWWVDRYGLPTMIYRFDVVEVAPEAGRAFAIHHIEDAWRPEAVW